MVYTLDCSNSALQSVFSRNTFLSPGEQPEANKAHNHEYLSVMKPASSHLPGISTAASRCTLVVFVYPSNILHTFTVEYPSNPTEDKSESLKKPSTMRPSFTEPVSMTGMYFTKIMSHFIY